MIAAVKIVNEITKGDNTGKLETIELSGEQFSYIVREAMTFGQMYNYLRACGRWELVED